MKILVVDDNRDLADGLADLLDVEGYEAIVANTVKQAREAFSENRFDYIFLDMKLPDGNGLELYYEFHAHSPGSRIILMTGFRIEQLLQQLVDSGAVALLRKPFTMKQVGDVLGTVMPGGIMLVADDSPDTPEELAKHLQQNGIRPGMVRNHDDIDVMLGENRNDVIIVDLNRPILCCMEVYLQMKAINRVVPMIVMVSQVVDSSGDKDVFREISTTNCLFKPFHPVQILEVMQQSTAA